MGVDEVAILAVVLHAGAHTAPHALVDLRVDAVALRAQGGEIDVSACRGVLRREDVVERGILIEVGIASIVSAVGEHLRELEHIVGVATFGSVELVDVAVAGIGGEEMLVHAVAADAHGPVVCHVGPEVLGGLGVSRLGVAVLVDTFESDVLRHLGVGVPTVEKSRVDGLHAVEHGLVTVFLGGFQVFGVTKDGVSVGQHLVHASVLGVEHSLHGAVGQFGYDIDAPVAELAKHRSSLLAPRIEIGVTQASEHLVLTIEGHPAAMVAEGGDVARKHFLPIIIDRLPAEIAVQPFLVVIEGLLAVGENGEHVVKTFLELLLRRTVMAGGVGQRERAEVVAAHMAREVE